MSALIEDRHPSTFIRRQLTFALTKNKRHFKLGATMKILTGSNKEEFEELLDRLDKLLSAFDNPREARRALFYMYRRAKNADITPLRFGEFVNEAESLAGVIPEIARSLFLNGTRILLALVKHYSPNVENGSYSGENAMDVIDENLQAVRCAHPAESEESCVARILPAMKGRHKEPIYLFHVIAGGKADGRK